ncbi:hypothetical protein [Paraburkholderia dinghuensis]|uniref:Uncharacterized protein n=1 Tax=Paraburkholderia dinghuensis TaxID=2305225 RepID=A0A3N6PLD5_9BURK|nr:hypothetical protein [Paraburkholderia dinghuensis]RQH02230.1 hypothetical protein D1Y85_22400 [Paraburkholderia dinghuensis]
MKIKSSITAVMVISTSFIWGCSTYSDPLQKTEVISAANGGVQYRVECKGIFSSSSVCVRQMKKICGERQVRQVEAKDSKDLSLKSGDDPRSMTFMCVAANGSEAGAQGTQAR